MANKIGRFEILSEITHSEIGAVYKAADPESGQTIALKTIRLQMLAEQADTLMQYILQEAAGTKPLSSHNIAQLFGVEEIDGQCCAAEEYVQGNSIATMLARKEGFSIWDLQDIVRQTCQGLDHAHSHNVFHFSLEPAKIMVTWDGTVKVLSFGVSCMGAFTCQASGKAPDVLHYVSPEQLRGDPVDGRSNIFSLGAILYEMATENKAFPGDDADQVRQGIVEVTPAAPIAINPKIHPVLSEVIMKALSKAPEERYQSGQELVNDLERCKESATKVVGKKTAQPAASAAPVAKAPVASAPVANATTTPSAPEPQKISTPAPDRTPAAANASSSAPVSPVPSPARAAAAAAGWEGASAVSTIAPTAPKSEASANPVKASAQSTFQERASAVADVAEPETEKPSFRVDPQMAAEAAKESSRGPSFSEMNELPPLKEIYTPPPPPPAAPEAEAEPAVSLNRTAPEKPKVEAREVARKAVSEIKKTPPKLFLLSIAGAVAIILLVVGTIAYRIHSENSAEEGSAEPPASAAPAEGNAKPAWSPAQPPVAAAVQAPLEQVPMGHDASTVSVVPKYNNKKKTKAQPAAAPAVIPGQLTINSTPEGAEVRIDGRSDLSWITPFNLPGLAPGQHSVTVARAGYAPETRAIEVASGSKSFLVIQLAQLTAAAAVTSQPAGAQIFLDGKDTGKLTPAQISVDKPGPHTFLIRKQGYLEESSSASLQAGQIFHFAPTLKALGSVDDIKLGGKFKKIFGGGDTAGMGALSVKTTPKGAQVAVNNRILDKFSPVDFYLSPGTYVIDITASGYKPFHKIIDVEKGSKLAIEENLDRE
jgi:eukaryotic-like serine/threonine-protein kinase